MRSSVNCARNLPSLGCSDPTAFQKPSSVKGLVPLPHLSLMAAVPPPGPRQRLTFPPQRKAHWQDTLPDQLQQLHPGAIELNMHDWPMRCRNLSQLRELLQNSGFRIALLQTLCLQTAISAQGLGLPVQLQNETDSPRPTPEPAGQLRVHRGTVRSGDRLESSGDLVVLGDVNPGATISANGDVMVWGRLRGIAHAGREGDRRARVVALQLRPLQLRIADQVARGPDDQPQAGLAEEARIEEGEIVIEPADPRLSDRILRGDSSAPQGESVA